MYLETQIWVKHNQVSLKKKIISVVFFFSRMKNSRFFSLLITRISRLCVKYHVGMFFSWSIDRGDITIANFHRPFVWRYLRNSGNPWVGPETSDTRQSLSKTKQIAWSLKRLVHFTRKQISLNTRVKMRKPDKNRTWFGMSKTTIYLHVAANSTKKLSSLKQIFHLEKTQYYTCSERSEQSWSV